MTEKLKPCPFCGGEASMHANYEFRWVECDSCELETNTSDSVEAAVKRWNTRHAEPSNDRRERIAVQCLAGLLASNVPSDPQTMARFAVARADALIAELDGGES